MALRFNAEEFQYLGKVGDASTEQMDYVFAVSDGMGGARAGEFASRITVDKIAHLLPRSFQLSAAGVNVGHHEVLSELYGQVHKALTFLGESDEECSGMGATLSLCWFTPAQMFFAHIGDSRIYYLAHDGGFRQITQDDTHVGWLYRRGEINEREARSHPRRNALQKALGAGHQFVDPQVGAVTYESGDVFLLCTDGLIDGLYNHHLEEYLRAASPGTKGRGNPAEILVNASLEQSGRDNITAVVVEVM